MNIFNRRSIVIFGIVIIIVAMIGLIMLIKRLHPSTQPTNEHTVEMAATNQNNNSPKIADVTSNPLFKVPCKDDAHPVFNHDLTDPSFIDHIQIYGLGEIFPRFRSFLWIKPAKADKIPIYAPIDSDLVEAVYKNARGALDFDVHLMVSCQIWYLVNHITDPVNKIRQALPSTPATTTMDPPPISPSIHFATGELLGYTTGTPLAHNWDFGVFDLTHANVFINQARFDQDKYGKFQTAICPFDVFPDTQKALYYGLFGETKPTPGAKCGPLSPDKPGTISGSWFADKFVPGQHSELKFKLMIGIYNDGVIRITGEDFQPSIEIPSTNTTYIDPMSVTDHHCFASGGKTVDFKVVSDQEIQVVSTSRSCGTTFSTSGAKTYYR